MQLQEQVDHLLAAGKEPDAVALLEMEAARGSPWADFTLAALYLAARGVERDPVKAVQLLERAAGTGSVAAAMRLVSLYATGTGGPVNLDRALAIIDFCKNADQFAAVQHAILQSEPDCEPLERKILDQRAGVILYRGAVSTRECTWIRTLARPKLEASMVVETSTGKLIPHPVRTSSGMSFGPLDEDLVVNRINRRLARLSGTDFRNGEPLHVLRYSPGEQYREHFDAIPGERNQRTTTAIIYLNQDYSGGSTVFPALDLEVRGQEGDVLVFSNVLPDGSTNPCSRHAGLPVTDGEKWIATRWIRTEPYHPWNQDS